VTTVAENPRAACAFLPKTAHLILTRICLRTELFFMSQRHIP